MRVAADLALRVELLRRRKVVGVRVREETGFHILDGHLDRERRARFDETKVRREDELGRWHIVARGDGADGVGIARARPDLLAIGDR